MPTGITRRHSRTCRFREGGRCNCNAGWEASVYSKRDGRKVRKTFPAEAEAKSWRADATAAVSTGMLRAPTRTTLRQAVSEWLRGAEAGEIRNRSGHPYKPSTLRGYRHALDERVLPEIGAAKLAEVSTTDLQALVDRWQADRIPASTIRNTIKPLQAIYRRAKSVAGCPRTRPATWSYRLPGHVRLRLWGVGWPRVCSRRSRPGTGCCGRPRCTPGCATAS